MVQITIDVPNFLFEPVSAAVVLIVATMVYMIKVGYGMKGEKHGIKRGERGTFDRGKGFSRISTGSAISHTPLESRKDSPDSSDPYNEHVAESIIPPRRSTSAYRMDQESGNLERSHRKLSKVVSRDNVWCERASWQLPSAPSEIREKLVGLDTIKSLLHRYQIDPHSGFLPSDDPIQRLQYETYHLWEDLADDLPKLLGARLGQARDPLRQLPVITTEPLQSLAELRRAHLLLCLFAHAYVWGGKEPIDELPEGIAVPLWDVSNRLGIPPVLGHPSIVMYNYRRLDRNAEICMENLSTLNNFFDGRDESWFYLITVEIEAKGAAAIVPLLLTMNAIERSRDVFATVSTGATEPCLDEGDSVSDDRTDDDEKSDSDEEWTLTHLISKQVLKRRSRRSNSELDTQMNSAELHEDEITIPEVMTYVISQLKIVSRAISEMTVSLKAMREGCHPFIFYHRVRPFLSGWKHNPTLPHGILYKGVSIERQQFYGGSAAQSSLIPFLDIALGITHDSPKSTEFLDAMRDYMIPQHRGFLEHMQEISNLREFVLRCSELRLRNSGALKEIYDECVVGLQEFRTGHITLVADYIVAQQRKDIAEQESVGGMEKSAGGKGTGGTDLMKFLKPIRDDCTKKLINVQNPPHDKKFSFTPITTQGGSVSSLDSMRHRASSTGSTTNGYDSNGNFSDDEYFKDCGDPEDIDLYRGGYSTTSSSLAKIHEFKSKGVSVLTNLSVSKLSHIIHYSCNAYYNNAPLLTDVEYDQIKDLQRLKMTMSSTLSSSSSPVSPRGCMMGGSLSMPGAYGNKPKMNNEERVESMKKCPFSGSGATQTDKNGRLEEPGCPFSASKDSGTYQ